MKQDDNDPLYTIGIAARLIKVCQATLRIWERNNLIKPARRGKNRFYSKCDLDRLEYIKELIQENGINIAGVRNILNSKRCWEEKNCKPKERNSCLVYIKHSTCK